MSYGMQGPMGMSGNKIPKGYKGGQIQQFTPEMMQFFQQMMGMMGPESFLGKLAGGDQSIFGEIEAPAMKQFGEMQGQLASRFSGQGMGSRRGSGFQNTMNQATSDFAQQLQSNRSQMRMNAIHEMLGMGNALLGQRPYESFLTQKPPSFMESMAPAMGQAAGMLPYMLMML